MTMKITRSAGVVFLSGVIDENADFSPLLQEEAPLSLNLSGVERVNSVGLRSWMRFMVQWGDKTLKYLECPVVVSDQIAIIPALRGIKSRSAQVISAMIPYECYSCQHQEDLRVTDSQFSPQPDPKALNPECPKCKEEMELVNPGQLSIFEP